MQRALRAATGIVATAAALAGLAASARAGQPAPTLADVVGTWEGQWVNTRYGTFAPARIRIETEGNMGTLGVDLDSGPNGSVFGLGFDPPEVVFTAELGSQSMSKEDSLFGDAECTGNPSSFSCTGNMISAFVLSGTLTGSVTGNTAHADYRLIVMDFDPIADGYIEVTKVPEPAIGAAGAAVAALVLTRRSRRADQRPPSRNPKTLASRVMV